MQGSLVRKTTNLSKKISWARNQVKYQERSVWGD